MVVPFLGNSMDDPEDAHCPMCFGQMELEEHEECAWLICPNGCPTEYEAPPKKSPSVETELTAPEIRAAAGGA